MRIAIPDDYPNAMAVLACRQLLAGHQVDVFRDAVADPDLLAERLGPAEVLVLTRDRTLLTEALIARLPNLKLVSSICRVGPHIDIAACTRRGIAVADGGPGYSPATVELTWALILASMRKLCLEDRRLREGRWQTSLGIGCLTGRTLGILGYGRLGRMVAAIAPAFGMAVAVHGSETSMQAAREAGFTAIPDRRAFFAGVDVLSLHLRLTDSTRGSVTLDDLLAMKQDALFVNVARAELLAPDALVQALRTGRPGHAAVDVYEQEPVLGAQHPLAHMDNVVCSPHLGYVDRDSYERYFTVAFQNILDFAAGRPGNIVNPEYTQAR